MKRNRGIETVIFIVFAFVTLTGFMNALAEGTVTVPVVGSTITFGSYEQDNDPDNGKEPIEWLVLNVEGNEALIITKYGLFCHPYHPSYTSVTWETCELRNYLNDTFLNDAFSETEQGSIAASYLKNPRNDEHGSKGGNDTTDQVFLLTIYEAGEYFPSDELRKLSLTESAQIQRPDVTRHDYVADDGSITYYWLTRTPGYTERQAAIVRGNGYVQRVGPDVDEKEDVIRPAIRIDLETAQYQVVSPATAEWLAYNGSEPQSDLVGRRLVFGNYEQDNDISNGPEPIEWQILAVEDDRVLILSRYALECMQYNSDYSLRETLNNTSVIQIPVS